MNPTTFQAHMCKTQGDLFELSAMHGLDSRIFIETFMKSDTAAHMDLPYDRTQWCGEAYLLEEIDDQAGGLPKGTAWDPGTLHWIGYTYRYWHFLRNIASKDIYPLADAMTMYHSYPGYHTVDCELAIDWLTEPH